MDKPILSRQRVEELKQKYYTDLNKKLKKIDVKQDFYGPTPPNILVGDYNYPNVRIGSMLSLGNAELSANPTLLYGKPYSTIINEFGLNLLGINYGNVHNREMDDVKDSVLSYKTIDMEAKFKHKPNINPKFNPYTIPTGYSAQLKKIRLAENPKIPTITYKVLNDDLLAKDAIGMIAGKTDIYYTSRLLTAGLLGKEGNKKLVPTRWAITAVDDMLGKEMINEIKDKATINQYEVYENEFLHNRFIIALLPGPWEYEQFEAWPIHSAWGTDWGFNQEYEPFKGRTKYADKQAGGYYAARFGVVEHLSLRRKQAKVIVIREIDDEYSVPVGVWQVRENVRNAMKNEPKRFEKMDDVLNYIKTKLKIKLNKYLEKDIILKQKTLLEF